MRTREIFLASLLTLTFGCPGDDGGGETGSHETEHHDTEHHESTSGSTGSPTTTPMETSTTASTDSTSTTASMDSTSTTTPGESTSGSSSSGGVNEVCEMFCADYFGVCGDSADNDYGTEDECLTTCEGYDQKELDCKVYHVSVADGPKSVHCGHANIDGGGTC